MLDETDFKILNLLLRNGRASFASLGDAVGLSPHGAADRVRRLERAGVITGYAAVLDLPKVGRSLDAFVDVRLLPTAEPEQFEAFCASLPAVRELAFVTGRFDYHVRVACHSADELDQTVRAIRRRGGAAQTETRIVLRKADVDQDVSGQL
ncbi:MAG TPA: Lrp/AsnC family transcriptional regulator [Capillimicrobium sp.]|nr:Lrp/AsnC family transcriptional regulator [Capillimicrobium sp.]